MSPIDHHSLKGFFTDRKQIFMSRPLPMAALLCVFLLFLNGCHAGARQKPTVDPLPHNGTVVTPGPQEEKAPEVKGQSQEEPAVVKQPLLAPQLQLLQSAGRDPHAKQPEEEFILEVPNKVWAGEPFLLRVGGQGLESVTVFWRDKKLVITPGKNNQADATGEVLLSVLQKEKSASLPIKLELVWESGDKETMEALLPVGKRKRPVQRLKVAQKYVTPDPSVLEKIKQDQRQVRGAISKITQEKNWSMPMLRPVPGQVTSVYGLRRFFNGQERNPHRGIDFDAKTGDPIAASDAGTVVVVADHYYGGQTVIIDHGLGVFSLYLHLSGFNVTEGQQVQRGDTIGFIGSTGRVTGPHLHFSLAVQGEMVDAAPFMQGMKQ